MAVNVQLSHPVTIGSSDYPAGTVVSVDATFARRLVLAGMARYTDQGPTQDPATTDEYIRDLVASLLVAGSGVTITVDDTANTVTIASTVLGGGDPETIRDTIGAALVAGAGINIAVNDGSDTITITSTVTVPTDESIQDMIGTFLQPGAGVSLVYNDAGNQLTIHGGVRLIDNGAAVPAGTPVGTLIVEKG